MAHSTEYLKRRGGKWHLKLPIPKDIRRFYTSRTGKPREHIEVALGTSDVGEANRKKHPLIAHWQRDFAAKRNQHAGALPAHVAEALRMREHLRAFGADGGDENAPDPVADFAEDLHERQGKPDQAAEFVALARAKETLREAWGKWQARSGRTNATRAKDKQAFEGLMTFLGTHDALAEHVTRAKARAYVDWLNESAPNARTPGEPLAYATKQGLIAPLRRFWDDYLDHNELIPTGTNPWRNPKVTGAPTASAPNPNAKRDYTDAEIVALLNGPELPRAKQAHYPKRTLMELYALLFYTGARLGEVTNLRLADVEAKGSGYVIHVRRAKTGAGLRRVPVVHPIPVGVLRARIGKRKDPKAQLFAEFIPGGTGKSLGHYPSKALGRYRDRVGLGTSTDSHGARHTFVTRMKNNLGADPAHVDQYVGHKLPGMAGRYVHATDTMLLAVAKLIRYPAAVERGFEKALRGTFAAKL